MNANNQQYIPALRYNWLTWLYDPVVALTTREKTFKKTHKTGLYTGGP